MFNVGFKELIEKCEEYFGKRVTKIGVATIGLCVIIFVIGFAVTNSVYPLALWIGAMMSGNPQIATARDGVGLVVTVVWVVCVVALVVSYLQIKPYLTSLPDMADEGEEWLKDVAARRDEAKKVLADTQALYARVEEAAKAAGLDVAAIKDEARREASSPAQQEQLPSPPSSASHQK